jgi:hypothetical protein
MPLVCTSDSTLGTSPCCTDVLAAAGSIGLLEEEEVEESIAWEKLRVCATTPAGRTAAEEEKESRRIDEARDRMAVACDKSEDISFGGARGVRGIDRW